MSKANSRKRANKKPKASVPIEVKVVDREQALPLYQTDTVVFNELVELSNQFAKLDKQHRDYEFIRVNLIARRKKIQKGEIKLPIQIQLTQDMYYSEDDKKKVLAVFDEQIKTITNSVAAVKQHVTAARDMYIESGLRLLEFSKDRYGQYKMQEFKPRGATITESEKELMEEEYNELFKANAKDMQKPEVQAAFKEAMKLAKEKNVKK